MKKFGIFLILCVMIILPVTVNAQTTDATKITGSFSVIKPDTQTVDVELTKGTKIDKGKGNFEFKITYKKKDLVGLFYELTRDSKSIAKNSLYSDQIGEKIGTIKTVPVEISGFTPGSYELKISDLNNSVEYASKKFMVTVEVGNASVQEEITADDYGLVMNIDSNDGINLKFSGTVTPKKDISDARLRVQFKKSTDKDYPLTFLPYPLIGTKSDAGNVLNLDKGETYSYSYSVPSLLPNTSYNIRIVDIPYLEIKEINHTTGGGVTTPDTSTGGKITAESYGFPDTVSVIPDTTTAILEGTLSPIQNIPDAQLYVFFGISRDSLTRGGLLTSVPLKEDYIPFKYIFENLNSGTEYFYKIRDNRRLLDVTQIKSFKTSGTKSGTENPVDPKNTTVGGNSYVFDPNAQTGIFGNYSYPTNLSEPDSGSGGDRSYDGKPLVPCGKKSDQGGEDATCRFKHVIILFNNIINYMLVLMVPMIALISIYVGIMMIVKRQVPAELLALKDKFSRIGIGILVMFLAWVLVATLLKALVNDESSAFILLDLVNF